MKLYEDLNYLEGLYADTGVQLYENLEYNARDIIKMADFYSLSRYMSGMKDDLGRDKSFYNVVNFRVTIAKTATEFDIKDFVASADDTAQWVQTLLFNREAYEWMKRTRFSRFLNKYALTRPKYGGVLYKKVVRDGEVYIEVCDWRNILTDQVDITGSPIIEKHYLSPLDFYAKKGKWENVDAALELFEEKKKKEDEAVGRLEVWEVTGVMSENAYREAQGLEPLDEDTYTLQKHFVLMAEEEKDRMVFYSSKPKSLGYRYLSWEEVPGRGLGRGVIEESEEGQVWINDSMLKQRNTMDIAGRVLIKTDADNIANNILEVDDGKIFKLEPGRDMQAMQLAPAALGNYENMVNQWNMQLDKATSTFDANTGETMPSGTPYSQTALLNQVAQRPFAFRQEEAAIDLEEMFNEWIVPHIIKKIKADHILASEFDDTTLEAIDHSIANKAGREVMKKAAFESLAKAISGELGAEIPVVDDEVEKARAETLESLRGQGAKRYIKIPENFFEGFTGKMTLNITNEQQNKAAIMQSLSQILQTITGSYNPQTGKFMVLEDPVLAKIFGSIIETAGIGISPVELGIGRVSKQTAAPAAPPQGGAPSPVSPAVSAPTQAGTPMM